MPERVLAIIAAYNEERFIGSCLEHLFANGVEAYLCDNESTDHTVEIAKSYLGRGLRGIETLPRDGTYRWQPILARKEELARDLDADWFLHLDPDEIPQSSRPGLTLAEAFAEADAAGYNALEFDELAFVATRESPDHDHPDFRRTMRWYYPFAPGPLHRVIAWKRTPDIDLVSSGGHQARFRDRRISPQRHFLRHYIILSREHMLRKYVQRAYDATEVRNGWHGWRARVTADDVTLPSEIELRFTANDRDLDASSPRRQHWIEWPARDSAKQPRVLCIVNRPNWAHDLKTRALATTLAGHYQLVIRYQSEVTVSDIESADLVLVHFWLQIDQMPHLARAFKRASERLILGVCSEYELEGAWRKPGLAMLSKLPRAVFAINLKLVKRLEATLGRQVFYTPNGVDSQFYTPVAAPRQDGMLRVGWAGSLKNHTAEHRGVPNYIAPAVASVEGTELRLAAREERWRTPEEMREFYQSLDVYVCASRSEGAPNPCHEAAACGVPVITTRVGSMPEFIRDGENGFFIERDVEDIAAKLRRLRDDRKLREQMGRAARASVEAWDWRHLASRYVEMFDAVLGDAREQHDDRKLIKRVLRRLRLMRPARGTKVFGIGYPKTGTKTLGDCFEQLGFKHRSFDMRLSAQAKRNQLENVLAEAKKYESFEDWPWFFLYRELDQRFPNSKFVLTLRKDTDAYVASLKKHHERQGIRRKDFVPPEWWNDVFGFPPDQWDYAKSALGYESHNRAVLEYFKDRPDDLLVVCWERGDGWDSLCEFLNKRIPRRPFPHQNRGR